VAVARAEPDDPLRGRRGCLSIPRLHTGPGTLPPAVARSRGGEMEHSVEAVHRGGDACPVWAMLKASTPITSSFRIEG
jgi:hypothetical protein